MVDTTTVQARDTGQQLERRRADLVNSREQAAAGRLAVAEFEGRADALRGSREDTKRRLQEAEQLAERLQRELKKDGKERDQLERQIRSARKALVDLDRRAVTREQKYDRAVLAELVEREKVRDLSAAPATAAAPDTAATPGTPSGTEDQSAEAAAPSASSIAPVELVGRVTEQDKPGEPVTVTDRKADGTTTTRRTRTAQPTAPAKVATGRAATSGRSAAGRTTSTQSTTAGTGDTTGTSTTGTTPGTTDAGADTAT